MASSPSPAALGIEYSSSLPRAQRLMVDLWAPGYVGAQGEAEGNEIKADVFNHTGLNPHNFKLFAGFYAEEHELRQRPAQTFAFRATDPTFTGAWRRSVWRPTL